MARFFPLRARRFSGKSRPQSAENVLLWLQMGAFIFLSRPFFWVSLTAFALLFFYSSFFLPPIFGFFIGILLPNFWGIGLQSAFLIAHEQKIRFKKYFDFLLFLMISLFSILAVLLYSSISFLKITHSNPGLSIFILKIFILFLILFLFFLLFSFTPLLILNQKMDIFLAIHSSIVALFNNWLAFCFLFAFCLLFLLMSIFTAGLATLIILPILAGTFFAAYEDIFEGV